MIEHIVLENSDMKIVNSAGGEVVLPKCVKQSVMEGGIITSCIHRTSWNLIRLGKK